MLRHWFTAAATIVLTAGACGVESLSLEGRHCDANRSCVSGFICDEAADLCVRPSCVPKACLEVGNPCGPVDDGCGGLLVGCSTCVAPDRCIENKCTCAAGTCQQRQAGCGVLPKQCSDPDDRFCGNCPDGQICGAGGDHQCGVGTCVPRRKSDCGATCEKVSDGCGGILDCGACALPQTCGGAGRPNECGCTPRTCAQLGWSCGSGPDGCGGTITCPNKCLANQTCNGDHGCCTPTTCTVPTVRCGPGVPDSCGHVLSCSDCEPSRVCDAIEHVCRLK